MFDLIIFLNKDKHPSERDITANIFHLLSAYALRDINERLFMSMIAGSNVRTLLEKVLRYSMEEFSISDRTLIINISLFSIKC